MYERKGFGLVLSRKVGENIVIGNNIVVKLLAIKGSEVVLGFVAPKEVPIWREEATEKRP